MVQLCVRVSVARKSVGKPFFSTDDHNEILKFFAETPEDGTGYWNISSGKTITVEGDLYTVSNCNLTVYEDGTGEGMPSDANIRITIIVE